MTQFAVVQDEYAWDDWRSAAEVLAAVLAWHPTVANQRAKNAHGFLAENVEELPARRIHQECRARGLHAHLVPEANVVVLPRAIRTHQLWLRDDALWSRRSETGPVEPIGWDTLVLLAALRTTKTETFHRWSLSRESFSDAEMQNLKVTRQNEEMIEYLADIVAFPPDGPGVRLRLASREINYVQALGADAPDALVTVGARMLGFRLLLARIHAHAGQARVPPETVALLGGPPPATAPRHALQTVADFDAYNRWLVQIHQIDGLPPRPPTDPGQPLR